MNGYVYTFGGMSGDHFQCEIHGTNNCIWENQLDKVFYVKETGGNWAEHPQKLTQPRVWSTSVVYNNGIIIVGQGDDGKNRGLEKWAVTGCIKLYQSNI